MKKALFRQLLLKRILRTHNPIIAEDNRGINRSISLQSVLGRSGHSMSFWPQNSRGVPGYRGSEGESANAGFVVDAKDVKNMFRLQAVFSAPRIQSG